MKSRAEQLSLCRTTDVSSEVKHLIVQVEWTSRNLSHRCLILKHRLQRKSPTFTEKRLAVLSFTQCCLASHSVQLLQLEGLFTHGGETVKQSCGYFLHHNIWLKYVCSFEGLRTDERKVRGQILYLVSSAGLRVFARVSLLTSRHVVAETLRDICWTETTCTESHVRVSYFTWSTQTVI